VDAARPRPASATTPDDASAPPSAERWLAPDAHRRLEQRLAAALRRARSAGASIILSSTTTLPRAVDPSQVVVASRRQGEHWFCLEEPDRDRWALGALGCTRALEATGATRFTELARRWRSLVSAAHDDGTDGPPGSGLVAVGGFAFASDGGASVAWDGFPPASLIVPEVSLARAGERATLTLNLEVVPDDTVEQLLKRAERRLTELRELPLPLVDPSPAGTFRVHSPMPPSHYEAAVARAVQRIRDGELEKVALAREVDVHAPADHDPGAIFGLLREEFRSCYVFAVGRGDATFIAASPELLVRREGQRATTVALAGSIGRSADPSVDDHLGERLLRSDKDRAEHAIVARRITLALRRHAVWVAAAPEPVLVRVANIQHLATPIRAQLANAVTALELAGTLHPTPAVGGEPREQAIGMIPALEGIDRGWYAGTVGWTDGSGDGEFCVALRCALLRGPLAQLYAGCGIVRDSDPTAELAETEVKLGALLPALVG
jgi:salicylate biosynthesis isochorismate synthase